MINLNENIVELDTVFGGNVFVDISKVVSISANKNEGSDIAVEIIFDRTKRIVQTTLDMNNYTKLVNKFKEGT